MRVDRVEADAFDPVDRGMEADRADDVRRARLEPRGRVEVGRLCERDAVDHRPAALPRRHGVEQLGARPTRRRCRSGRRACGRRRRRSRSRSRRHRPACAAPPGSRRAAAWRRPSMRDVGGAPGVEDRAEHVRDMGEGDDAMLVADHRLGGVEVDLAVGGQRHDVDLRSRRAATGRCCSDARARRAGRGCGPPRGKRCATRLIASVAPRVKTSSRALPADQRRGRAARRFVSSGSSSPSAGRRRGGRSHSRGA